jgi:aquaporin related protein
VGPGAGSIAAVLFYKFIKILEYEMANPGQEAASAEAAIEAAEKARHGVVPTV